jgi:hypothetical protein
MTIAIQGHWGSGKTSALNSVRKILEEKSQNDGDESSSHAVEVIYLSTWQYSLFGTTDNLTFSVLSNIMQHFRKVDNTFSAVKNAHSEDDGYSNLLNNIGSTLARVSRIGILTAAAISGRDATGVLNELASSGNSFEELSGLKDKFERLIERYCSKKNISKVVFFIDDLDRLPPARAVELLEVFKVLLDVKHTAFVLAIDFDIVKLGINDRYGIAGSNAAERDWKARSFFDKIVQVPFNMPLAAYDPTKLIKQQLDDPDSSQFKRYSEAVRFSVGVNPRAIKRLFNAFTLTKIISGGGDSAMQVQNKDEQTLNIFGAVAKLGQ